MSNVKLIIPERAANIGNFMVGRLLPFRQKRMVGPFVFIDHMGPIQLDENENLDVPPHPHIGLSTLTYLFEGAMMHRDSMGNVAEIRPGGVNWMTAGKGVVHSERTPEYLRGSKKALHGLQIWVGLPKELEQMEPAFTHIPKNEIPKWQYQGVTITLIAGELLGKLSPVPVHSKLYFLELKSTVNKKIDIGPELYGESGLYILEGSITSDGNTYGPKQILIAKNTALCEFELCANTTIYIFGGEPFPEERHIYWNFVSSEKGTIEAATNAWKLKKFPKVPGEVDYVPLPT